MGSRTAMVPFSVCLLFMVGSQERTFTSWSGRAASNFTSSSAAAGDAGLPATLESTAMAKNPKAKLRSPLSPHAVACARTEFIERIICAATRRRRDAPDREPRSGAFHPAERGRLRALGRCQLQGSSDPVISPGLMAGGVTPRKAILGLVV